MSAVIIVLIIAVLVIGFGLLGYVGWSLWGARRRSPRYLDPDLEGAAIQRTMEHMKQLQQRDREKKEALKKEAERQNQLKVVRNKTYNMNTTDRMRALSLDKKTGVTDLRNLNKKGGFNEYDPSMAASVISEESSRQPLPSLNMKHSQNDQSERDRLPSVLGGPSGSYDRVSMNSAITGITDLEEQKEPRTQKFGSLNI